MKTFFVLAWFGLFPLVLSAAGTPCAKKTDEGEKLLDAGKMGEAKKALEAAVMLCAKSKEKSARSFIALGKVLYESKQFKEAIAQFEEGLKREPGLPLAYMNIGACYMGMEDYEKAIEVLEKGIASKAAGAQDKDWQAKLNFNLGLAYFNVAAKKNDERDLTSETYFKKSRALNPSIGANYYYLGVIAEVMKKDRDAAAALYKQGCEKNYQTACEWLASIDTRMAGNRAPASVPAAGGAKMTPENEKRMAAIQTGYQKKGMDATSTASVITNLRNACSGMGANHCGAMLDNVILGLK